MRIKALVAFVSIVLLGASCSSDRAESVNGRWSLADAVLDPASTSVVLAVSGGDCGATPRTQSITYAATTIEIAVDLVPPDLGPGEVAPCPIPMLTVALSEPIGNRQLVDANR